MGTDRARQSPDWHRSRNLYGLAIFVRGEKTDECPGIPREKVAEVLAKIGELSLCEILHCRVRYMSDGVAIGSRAFLERVFEASRSLFGKRRTDGPRPMKGGAAWAGLMTLRDLRLAPIS